MTSAGPGTQQPRSAILGQLPPIRRPDGSAIKVLLIDDERALTNLVTMALRVRGLGRRRGPRRPRSADQVRRHRPRHPGAGHHASRRRRAADPAAGPLPRAPYTPVLFLTARDSVTDRVTGLTAGADDYLTKPFDLQELVLRLRGLLRRGGDDPTTSPTTRRCASATSPSTCASREVTRGGERIELTTTEFDLLRYLMRNPRRALTASRSSSRCGTTPSVAAPASSTCTSRT